ncbi:MAG: glycosyltransferase family 4 protein [Candidatus Glassbacteria bacterium]|nr:glycosyltransferase family 4 protein [Candidatus Glassbacteria bacterium]
MPLENTAWERGKGGYKLIQYMAAGVATLSSPVGANLEIVEESRTGLFADGPGQWSAKLGELLADRERCAKMGMVGRRRAEEMFDYRVTVRKLIALLTDKTD